MDDMFRAMAEASRGRQPRPRAHRRRLYDELGDLDQFLTVKARLGTSEGTQ